MCRSMILHFTMRCVIEKFLVRCGCCCSSAEELIMGMEMCPDSIGKRPLKPLPSQPQPGMGFSHR